LPEAARICTLNSAEEPKVPDAFAAAVATLAMYARRPPFSKKPFTAYAKCLPLTKLPNFRSKSAKLVTSLWETSRTMIRWRRASGRRWSERF
jgi:hypothetical protein